MPGVATASEVMLGMDHGFEIFKLFPRRAAGGLALLISRRALSPCALLPHWRPDPGNFPDLPGRAQRYLLRWIMDGRGPGW